MSLIDDMKERVRIEEIVGRAVPLTRSGQHLRGLCPFHREKTPSFYVFEDSQRFKCFGCGAGGDLVDFVMRHAGWDLQSALRELAGERQPFYSTAWGQAVAPVVIVEGQACAITLAQWGVSAVALAGAGAAASPTLLAQVRKASGDIVIGMDTDEAGQSAIPGIAAALMGAGIRPTQIRVVTWPAHDANDWLQAGATAEQAQALLDASPTWVEVLTERAAPKNGGEADDAGLRELFAMLARLDAYDLARVRERICDQLGIRRSEFDTILRAARRETGLSDDGKPKYQVAGGRTCHRYYDKGGNEVCDVLAHFDARITAEVVEDDGNQQERRFTIEGKLADGAKLPEVEVAATDYPAMSWVLEKWGAKALIEAGAATKDHLRAAIQLLSPAAPTRYIYSHLGWRTINGQPVYLGTTGAVGYEGVEVRVIQDLARYKLPIHPERPREAMEASLRFLETGDYAVTIPLWAAMYLAPLSSIIEPAFTLWVFGTTGSLKSTITALALCHFGTFAYNTPPASWTGTANALEKKAFLVKDAPLWIDDYVTQSTFGGMNELRAKVDQLLRACALR